MEVEFQMSKKDYVDFYKRYQTATLKKYSAFLITICIFILVAVSIQHLVWWMSVLYIIACTTALVFLLYFLPLLFVYISVKKSMSKNNAYLSKIRYTITEAGLKSEVVHGTSLRNWGDIISAGEIEGFFFLKLPHSKLLIVPKRSFISHVEATNFLCQIRTHTKENNLRSR